VDGVREFVYGGYVDEVVAYTQTVAGVTKRYYPHYNHLYSVAALTDTSGAVVERYTYDAYGKQKITDASGNVTRAKSSVGWDRGFTGYIADNETGLLYARSRMYSPGLGRFIGRDALGYVDGASLYAAYLVPNKLDPSGNEFIEDVSEVTLAQLWSTPGAGPGYLAATWGGAAPVFSGSDEFYTSSAPTGCCVCVRVEVAKWVTLTARTLNPSDGVGTVFTARGLEDIRAHEARRRRAMRLGYEAYLNPVQGYSFNVRRCGFICENTEAEARAKLQAYLDALRAKALLEYNTYNNAQRARINDENNNWRPNVTVAGVSLLDGYAVVNEPTDPPPFTPPPCPSSGCIPSPYGVPGGN